MSNHWAVQRIDDDRVVNGDQQFRVHWAPSWVSATKISAQKEIIEYFQRKANDEQKDESAVKAVSGVSVKRTTLRKSTRGVSWYAELDEGATGRAKTRAKSQGGTKKAVRFLTPSPNKDHQEQTGRGRTLNRDALTKPVAKTATKKKK